MERNDAYLHVSEKSPSLQMLLCNSYFNDWPRRALSILSATSFSMYKISSTRRKCISGVTISRLICIKYWLSVGIFMDTAPLAGNAPSPNRKEWPHGLKRRGKPDVL